MKNHLIFLVLPAALACMPAAAQLNKCAGPDGKMTYSDRQCQVGEKPAAVTAPRIPEPTKADAEAAKRRQMAADQLQRAEARRKSEAADDEYRRQVDQAANRVRNMKNANYDPRKCVSARAGLSAMKKREPIIWNLDISAFEFQMAIELHCGP